MNEKSEKSDPKRSKKRIWIPIVTIVAVVAAVGVVYKLTERPTDPVASGGDSADFVLNGWPQPDWLDAPKAADLGNYAGNVPDLYGGYTPVDYTEVTMTQADVDAIRAKNWKAAFLNWSETPFNRAFTEGMKRAYAELGIEMVATTNFEFDSSKAASDVLNVLPLDPDILVTGVLDPTQAAGILQPALDQGVTIELWGILVDGWKVGAGGEICNVVNYDPAYLGATVADGIHKQFPDGANVGVLRWNTNLTTIISREQGFVEQLKKYPNLKIVDTIEMADPTKADTAAAAMITRHPEVDVIFAPWDSPPGERVGAAIRASDTPDVKVATLDIGLIGAQDIAHNGPIAIDSGEAAYEGGRQMAMASALCRLGKDVPPYTLVPTFGVDKTNLNSAWMYMHGPNIPLPEENQIPGT